MNFLGLKVKWLILSLVVIGGGFLVYRNYSKQNLSSQPVVVIEERKPVPLAPLPVVPSKEDELKVQAALKQKQAVEVELKNLQRKLEASKNKYTQLTHLREIIDARVQMNLELLPLARARISHIESLQQEGAMNDQDIEFARAQLTSTEAKLEVTRQDAKKIREIISQFENDLAKDEAALKNLQAELAKN